MNADTVIERLKTGAPAPPPIWQMVCEFTNPGGCLCGRRGTGNPCDAVLAIEQRIKARAAFDLSQTHDIRRKPKSTPLGAGWSLQEGGRVQWK